MLVEQRPYFGSDLRVAGATGEPAFPVHRTCREGEYQDDGESPYIKFFAPAHFGPLPTHSLDPWYGKLFRRASGYRATETISDADYSTSEKPPVMA